MLAIVGLFTAVVVPVTGSSLERGRLRAASRHLGTLFRGLRNEAILLNRRLGVIFDPADGYAYSVYLDGNGNGIRRADIASGVDTRLRGPVRIGGEFAGVEVRIGPPPPIPLIPPERGRLDGLDDPVKFGPSDIVSFAANGDSSSGTVYLSIGAARMAAVRLSAPVGRVHFWEYDPSGHTWEQR
jgi:hypothetical protein